MPLLDSFTVDHTRMEAPAVRVAKTMQTPNQGHYYRVRPAFLRTESGDPLRARYPYSGASVRRFYA